MAGSWNNCLKILLLLISVGWDGIIGYPFSSSSSSSKTFTPQYSAMHKIGIHHRVQHLIPVSQPLLPPSSRSRSSDMDSIFHMPTRSKAGLALSQRLGFLDVFRPHPTSGDYDFRRLSAGLRRTRFATAVHGRFELLNKISKGFGVGRVARHLYEEKKRGQGFFGLDNHNFVLETLTQSRGHSGEEEEEREEEEMEEEPPLTSEESSESPPPLLPNASDSIAIHWLNPERFGGRRRQQLRVRPSVRPTPALSINADLAKLRDLMEKAGR